MNSCNLSNNFSALSTEAVSTIDKPVDLEEPLPLTLPSSSFNSVIFSELTSPASKLKLVNVFKASLAEKLKPSKSFFNVTIALPNLVACAGVFVRLKILSTKSELCFPSSSFNLRCSSISFDDNAATLAPISFPKISSAFRPEFCIVVPSVVMCVDMSDKVLLIEPDVIDILERALLKSWMSFIAFFVSSVLNDIRKEFSSLAASPKLVNLLITESKSVFLPILCIACSNEVPNDCKLLLIDSNSVTKFFLKEVMESIAYPIVLYTAITSLNWLLKSVNFSVTLLKSIANIGTF